MSVEVLLTRLRGVLYCALLVVLIVFVLHAIAVLTTVRSTVEVLPALVQTAVREQGEETRKVAVAAIADIRADTFVFLIGTRKELLTKLDAIGSTADRRAQDLVDKADAQLSAANQSLARVAAFPDTLRPTVAHVNEASGVLLRRDALPAQVLGLTAATKVTMGEVAQTMKEIKAVTPETAKAVKEGAEAGRDLAKSSASIAKSWEKQTPIWVRAIGWLGKGFLGLRVLIN